MFKFAQKKSNNENEQNMHVEEAEEDESCETEEKQGKLESVKENGEERIG